MGKSVATTTSWSHSISAYDRSLVLLFALSSLRLHVDARGMRCFQITVAEGCILIIQMLADAVYVLELELENVSIDVYGEKKFLGK